LQACYCRTRRIPSRAEWPLWTDWMPRGCWCYGGWRPRRYVLVWARCTPFAHGSLPPPPLSLSLSLSLSVTLLALDSLWSPRMVLQSILKAQWNDAAVVMWMNSLLRRCLRAWRLHVIDASAARTECALVGRPSPSPHSVALKLTTVKVACFGCCSPAPNALYAHALFGATVWCLGGTLWCNRRTTTGGPFCLPKSCGRGV
jgi:hypothetical protein